jgi:1-acyl-sn-glycerol-3-phosphate acyltransferase
MRLRTAWRAASLGSALLICVLRWWSLRLLGPVKPEARARWMHFAGRLALAFLGVRLRVVGVPPKRGLVVSNHLSYLDIVICSAAMPCSFVSKAEIAGWPFFGMLAGFGGNLFLDRTSRASARQVAIQIGERLQLASPILLFPEGTSTDGSGILPFYATLYEPAIQAGAPITAAAVRYIPNDGEPERELCWFGNDPFLPHLWKALGAGDFTAEVRFGEQKQYDDRRTAAAATRAEVELLRGAAGIPAMYDIAAISSRN